MMIRAADGKTTDLVEDGTPLDGGQTDLTEEAREALAGKIAESSFFEDDDDDAVAAVEDPDDKKDAVDDQDADDGDAVVEDADDTDDAGDKDDDDDADDDKDKQAAADDDDAASTPVSVPAAMRRSLKADQWTDEEIDGHYAADPDRAMKTFERIHGSRMKIMSEYARIGRNEANARQGQPSAAATDAVADHGIQAIDVAALTAEMGEENAELAQRIAKPINTVVAKIQAVMPIIERGVATAEHAEKQQALALIDTFFGSDDLKTYTKFYGDPAKGRTKVEMERYGAVLELADAMIGGAAAQGRNLDAMEAMEAAHHDVAADFQVQAVRSALKKSVKKKAAAVSLKPTSRGNKNTTSTGRAKTSAEREAKARSGLKVVFGG